MSEYESIHGTRVKYLTSDPTLDSTTEGQVWYNSTSGTNKTLVHIKAFSSSANTPTAGSGNASAVQATQATALSFGLGTSQPQTIEYSGYAWTDGGSLNTGRFVLKGAGTQTAALGFGGYVDPGGPTTATEEYDGSSWTAGGALPSGRSNMGGGGTQTAALSVGGAPSLSSTEEYNGSSWTAGGAYPATLQDIGIAGPQTASLGAGGISGPPTGGSTIVANYDGSSWTVVSGTIPNGQNRAATAGTQTHAVVFGGNTTASGPPNGVVTTASNEWDGSAFSITANMTTARQTYGAAGTGTSAVGFNGDKNPGNSNDTEEYSSSINSITQASWASGGNMGDKRSFAAGAGTQTAGIVFGGLWPSPAGGGGRIADTEEYDGSSWSEGGALNTGRTQTGGFGIQTAAVITSGVSPPGSLTNATEEYDGSSWTTVNTNPLSLRDGSCSGTLTAGLFFAGTASGSAPDMSVSTVEYDGTNWTSGGNLGTARYGMGSAGTQSDTLGFGGYVNGGGGLQSIVEAYNGTAWTSSPALAISQFNGASGGTSSSQAWFAGGLVGSTPNISGITQQYDGTGWSGVTPLSTARRALVGGGTSPAAFGAGGYGPGGVNTLVNSTEELTGETKTTTASTLTTS